MVSASLKQVIREFRPRSGSFSGEVLQTFLTNVGLTGLGVLSGIMLARLLGPVGRGELAAIQALPLIVASVGQLGLHEAVIFFGGRDRKNVGRYAISAAALILVAGIPIVLASSALAAWILADHAANIILGSQIFMALLFVYAIDGVAIDTARALHRITLWNVLRVWSPALWLLMVLGFFAAGVADPVRIALTYLALYAVLAPILVFSVRDRLRGHWRPDLSLWPSLLKYGLPVAAGVAPRLLNERIDQLVVAAMLPAHELGLYAVAVAWTAVAQIPVRALTGVALSKIAGMSGLEDQLDFVRKCVWATLVTSAATAAALALLTPLVIRQVFGPDFAGAVSLAWVMLAAVVIRSVTAMIQVGMQGIGRPTVGMYAQWSGLLVLVPTASALIPRLGVLGAAWALVVGAVVSVATVTLLARRAIRSARQATGMA